MPPTPAKPTNVGKRVTASALRVLAQGNAGHVVLFVRMSQERNLLQT
jgi:hypothetical protein